MAKKPKESILTFDNGPEVLEGEGQNQEPPKVPPANNNNGNNDSNGDNKNNSGSNSNGASNSDSILSSVLSKSTKEPKKVYTGFYLEEPVIKTINKIVKNNKDTNKSKLVNDLLTEAFKQAGLL